MSVKTVRLAKHSDVFQLLVDEQPFYIKGAGLELGSIQQLAAFGGNAFRTWRVEMETRPVFKFSTRPMPAG